MRKIMMRLGEILGLSVEAVGEMEDDRDALDKLRTIYADAMRIGRRGMMNALMFTWTSF